MKEKIKRFCLKNLRNWELWFLFCIIVISGVLRFYNISKLHFFTYDQARDDLIVKRILFDRKLTLIGPQSSVGAVYSPPIYYYTLILPLWIFGMSPVGPDIYTAFVGVLTVLLIYFAANKFFGKPSGLFASIFYATSPIIVEMSRRAWNPNTLPFFSLLTLFLAYQFWRTNQVRTLLLAAVVFGYTLSLHYSAFCLLPGFIYLWLNFFLKEKKIWPVLESALIIGLFFSPLLLFDFRHGFILSKNLFVFISQKMVASFSNNTPSFLEASFSSIYEVIVVPLSGYFLRGIPGISTPYEFIGRLKDTIFEFAPVSIIAHKPLIVKYYWWGQVVFLVILVFSFAKIFLARPKDKSLSFVWIWFLAAVIISRLYRGTIYFFYYLFLLPISFLFLGALLKWLFDGSKWLRFLVLVILLVMIAVNIKNNLIYEVSKRTITDIRAVAEIISEDVGEESFNVAANYQDPDRWDHHALDYRYFIETFYKKRPLDWYPENYRQSQILYFVSEGKIQNPLESKIMEVEEFKPRKLIKTWGYNDEIFVYKLAK